MDITRTCEWQGSPPEEPRLRRILPTRLLVSRSYYEQFDDKLAKKSAGKKWAPWKLSSAISNDDFFATLCFCHSLGCPPEAERLRWVIRVFRGCRPSSDLEDDDHETHELPGAYVTQTKRKAGQKNKGTEI
jgi:hypothetical protein